MRGIRIVLLAVLIVGTAVPLMAGKKKNKDAADGTAAAAPAVHVVARVEGAEISLEQLDESIQGRLSKIRTEEYELRRSALNEMIDDLLLENEAKARGVSVAELTRTEITDKAGEVSEEEIQRYYDANMNRNPQLKGKTLEQAAPAIRQTLSQQRDSARRKQFVAELKKQNDVKVMLQPPRVTVPVPEGEPSKGPEDAPIVLVEFSDFQCPYCKRAETTVEQVLAEYGDKIRLVYRDYPLSFHQRALPAAVAARCAGEQDKYWDYHQSLLKVNGNLSDEDLTKRAQDIQLDMAAFTACYDESAAEPAVQASIEDASALGVTGTPTFFINGRMLVGAKPYQEFKSIIEEELAFAEIEAASGG